MSAIIWYKLSGCCGGTTFQIQAATPPVELFDGVTYYFETDSYQGCASVIGTGFTSGVPTYILSNYDSFPYSDCSSCNSFYPCDPSVTVSASPTPEPTVTPTPGPTSTKTPTVTPTFTSTPTVSPSITPTKTVSPTKSVTPSITKTSLVFTPLPGASPTPTVTKTKTPTVTPTNPVTPSNTPSNSVTPSFTPTNSVAVTQLPVITQSNTPTITPTNTVTPTPSLSFTTGCSSSSFCLFTSITGYSQYDGTYYKYSDLNNHSFYYSPGSQVPAYIYYNTSQLRWCLSEFPNGECILFGPTNSNSVCPDLSSSYFNPSCPTPTLTVSDNCTVLSFDADFSCLVTGTTSTPTPSVTSTLTPTVTVSTTKNCSNKSVLVSGSTFYYPSLTPSPTSSLIYTIQNCIITSSTVFDVFESSFTSVYSKILTDCSNGLQYFVGESVPFNTGSTFSAIIDNNGVCVTYNGNIFSSPTNSLQSILSGNFFDCIFCSPQVTPSVTVTNSITPSFTPTKTITPSVTPCQNTNIDYSFITANGFNNINNLNKIIKLSDNSYLIAGDFTSYNTNPSVGLVKISNNGIYNNSFNTSIGFSSVSTNFSPVDMIETSDGKIICVGYFNSYSGISRNYICRLNSNGTLDTTFNIGSGFNNFVLSVSKQSDGKIIVGGLFTSYSGINCNYICRLNTDGSFDSTFNSGYSGFNSYVSSVNVTSGDTIVVGGDFTEFNGQNKSYIAGLTSGGTLNTDFGYIGGFDGTVHTVKITSDYSIYVSGLFNNYVGLPVTKNFTKLSQLGAIDITFINNLGTGLSSGYVNSIEEDLDGEIILFPPIGSTFQGVNRYGIVKISKYGILNTHTLPNPGFNSQVISSVVDSSNKIVCIGGFTTFNSLSRPGLLRLYPCQSTVVTPTPTSSPIPPCPYFVSLIDTGAYTPYDFLREPYNSLLFVSYSNTNKIDIFSKFNIYVSSIYVSGNSSTISFDITNQNVFFTEKESGYISYATADYPLSSSQIEFGTGNTLNNSIYDELNSLIWITNSTSSTLEILQTNDLSFTTNIGLLDLTGALLALDKVNSKLYVSSDGSVDNNIFVIDTVTRSVYTNFIVTTGIVKGLIYNNLNSLIYLLDNTNKKLYRIDTTTFGVIGESDLTFSGNSISMAFDDKLNYLYIVTDDGNSITTFNCNDNTQILSSNNLYSSVSTHSKIYYDGLKNQILLSNSEIESISVLCTDYTPSGSPTPTPTPEATPTPTNESTPTPTPSITPEPGCPKVVISINAPSNITSIGVETYNSYIWVGDNTANLNLYNSSYTLVDSYSLTDIVNFMLHSTSFNKMYVAYGSNIKSYSLSSLSIPTTINLSGTITGLAVVDTYLCAVDSDNNQINIIDTFTELTLGSVSVTSSFNGKIASDTSNNVIYVTDSLGSDVYVISPSGQILLSTISCGFSSNIDILYDQNSQYIYVLEDIGVLWYLNTSSLNVEGSIGLVTTYGVSSMSLDTTTGYIYIATDNGSDILTVDTLTNTQIQIKSNVRSGSSIGLIKWNPIVESIIYGDFGNSVLDILCTDTSPIISSPTPTKTPTVTPTNTPTNSETPTNTPSITGSLTPTPSVTTTITPTMTSTPTVSPSSICPFGVGSIDPGVNMLTIYSDQNSYFYDATTTTLFIYDTSQTIVFSSTSYNSVIFMDYDTHNSVTYLTKNDRVVVFDVGSFTTIVNITPSYSDVWKSYTDSKFNQIVILFETDNRIEFFDASTYSNLGAMIVSTYYQGSAAFDSVNFVHYLVGKVNDSVSVINASLQSEYLITGVGESGRNIDVLFNTTNSYIYVLTNGRSVTKIDTSVLIPLTVIPISGYNGTNLSMTHDSTRDYIYVSNRTVSGSYGIITIDCSSDTVIGFDDGFFTGTGNATIEYDSLTDKIFYGLNGSSQVEIICPFVPLVSPTVTPTSTQTPTITPTNTQTPTITPTNTQTKTPTNTQTPTITPTNTQTKTPTPSVTTTNTPSATVSCPVVLSTGVTSTYYALIDYYGNNPNMQTDSYNSYLWLGTSGGIEVYNSGGTLATSYTTGSSISSLSISFDSTNNKIFASNYSSTTVIDVTTLLTATTISHSGVPIPFSSTYDSNTGKLGLLDKDLNKVAIIDASSNTLDGYITLPLSCGTSIGFKGIIESDTNNGVMYIASNAIIGPSGTSCSYQGLIYSVNPSTLTTGATVNFSGYTINGTLTSLRFNPTNGYMYVLSSGKEVIYFDTTTNIIQGSISISGYSGNSYGSMIYNIDKDYLYISNIQSPATHGIIVIDCSTNTVIQFKNSILSSGGYPGIEYDSSSGRLFYATSTNRRVTVLCT